jgi:hypothetical protein
MKMSSAGVGGRSACALKSKKMMKFYAESATIADSFGAAHLTARRYRLPAAPASVFSGLSECPIPIRKSALFL